jgi:hypothetical protein
MVLESLSVLAAAKRCTRGTLVNLPLRNIRHGQAPCFTNQCQHAHYVEIVLERGCSCSWATMPCMSKVGISERPGRLLNLV